MHNKEEKINAQKQRTKMQLGEEMYVSLNYPEKVESWPEAAHVKPQLLEFRPLVFAMNEIDVQCGQTMQHH